VLSLWSSVPANPWVAELGSIYLGQSRPFCVLRWSLLGVVMPRFIGGSSSVHRRPIRTLARNHAAEATAVDAQADTARNFELCQAAEIQRLRQLLDRVFRSGWRLDREGLSVRFCPADLLQQAGLLSESERSRPPTPTQVLLRAGMFLLRTNTCVGS
jgi:hypothetical protein